LPCQRGFTTRECHRAAIRGIIAKVEDLRRYLEVLEKYAYIRSSAKHLGVGGRPPENWQVNPKAITSQEIEHLA